MFPPIMISGAGQEESLHREALVKTILAEHGPVSCRNVYFERVEGDIIVHVGAAVSQTDASISVAVESA